MNIESYRYETLSMTPFVLGYIENNTYLIADEKTKDCVLIDPSFGFDNRALAIQNAGLTLRAIWLTHGHFDHFIGNGIGMKFSPPVPSLLHPLDLPIFEDGGERKVAFYPELSGCVRPETTLEDNQILTVGEWEFKVLLTPGHSPGHCCFYCEKAGWLFTGDLIFYRSYGRTDLTGGSMDAIMKSILEKILTLPGNTVIFPGHNDFTTVEDERQFYKEIWH